MATDTVTTALPPYNDDFEDEELPSERIKMIVDNSEELTTLRRDNFNLRLLCHNYKQVYEKSCVADSVMRFADLENEVLRLTDQLQEKSNLLNSASKMLAALKTENEKLRTERKDWFMKSSSPEEEQSGPISQTDEELCVYARTNQAAISRLQQQSPSAQSKIEASENETDSALRRKCYVEIPETGYYNKDCKRLPPNAYPSSPPCSVISPRLNSPKPISNPIVSDQHYELSGLFTHEKAERLIVEDQMKKNFVLHRELTAYKQKLAASEESCRLESERLQEERNLRTDIINERDRIVRSLQDRVREVEDDLRQSNHRCECLSSEVSHLKENAHITQTEALMQLQRDLLNMRSQLAAQLNSNTQIQPTCNGHANGPTEAPFKNPTNDDGDNSVHQDEDLNLITESTQITSYHSRRDCESAYLQSFDVSNIDARNHRVLECVSLAVAKVQDAVNELSVGAAMDYTQSENPMHPSSATSDFLITPRSGGGDDIDWVSSLTGLRHNEDDADEIASMTSSWASTLADLSRPPTGFSELDDEGGLATDPVGSAASQMITENLKKNTECLERVREASVQVSEELASLSPTGRPTHHYRQLVDALSQTQTMASQVEVNVHNLEENDQRLRTTNSKVSALLEAAEAKYATAENQRKQLKNLARGLKLRLVERAELLEKSLRDTKRLRKIIDENDDRVEGLVQELEILRRQILEKNATIKKLETFSRRKQVLHPPDASIADFENPPPSIRRLSKCLQSANLLGSRPRNALSPGVPETRLYTPPRNDDVESSASIPSPRFTNSHHPSDKSPTFDRGRTSSSCLVSPLLRTPSSPDTTTGVQSPPRTYSTPVPSRRRRIHHTCTIPHSV